MDQKEKIRANFIEFVEHDYDALAYIWQFSNYKRLTMDRDSYLIFANQYFEEYYENHFAGKTMKFEAACIRLIEDFQKDDPLIELVE